MLLLAASATIFSMPVLEKVIVGSIAGAVPLSPRFPVNSVEMSGDPRYSQAFSNPDIGKGDVAAVALVEPQVVPVPPMPLARLRGGSRG